MKHIYKYIFITSLLLTSSLGQALLCRNILIKEAPVSVARIKLATTINDDLIRKQALLQISNSTTYQSQFLWSYKFKNSQYKAFKSLLLLLENNSTLRLSHLSKVNFIITEQRQTRRKFLNPKYIGVSRGLFKNHRVSVEMYQENTSIDYMPYAKVPTAMATLLYRINKLNNKSPLKEIATLYKNFMFIHPFLDGNGRTSRALLDYMLLKSAFRTVHHNTETALIMHYTFDELTAVLNSSLNEH